MSGILQTFAYGRAFTSPPVNVTAPVVSGTATVGQTLTTTNGTWTGLPAPTYTYQWQRVTTNISGATSSTYVLVAADAGSTIRCVVTATNSAGTVSANSNSTASVAATVPGAPTIGTATATGSTTATVAYTAPASNGGATITSYTATSSPGSITGVLSTSGSGTITVTGLSASTSYTFTVTATNSVGSGAASGASNSITTSASYFVSYLGLGGDIYNPRVFASVYTSYGFFVATNGYSVFTLSSTSNRALFYGIVNPSGAKVGAWGPTSAPTPNGYYEGGGATAAAAGTNNGTANYAWVYNGNFESTKIDTTTGGLVTTPKTWGFNGTSGAQARYYNAITSDNRSWYPSMGYDPKTGASGITFYVGNPGGSNQQIDYSYPDGTYFGGPSAIAVRSDNAVCVWNYNQVWLFASGGGSMIYGKATSKGMTSGEAPPAGMFDSNNNMYFMGSIPSGEFRICKLNSTFSSGNNYRYSNAASNIWGFGSKIYGNYLYCVGTAGSQGIQITAFLLSTMAVAWEKRVWISFGTHAFSGGNGYVNSVYANSTGLYIFATGTTDTNSQYLIKFPLDGNTTASSFTLNGFTWTIGAVAASTTLISTTAVTPTNIPEAITGPSYPTVNQGTADFKLGAQASYLPTVTTTNI